MSTRSTIAIQNEDGSVTGIYCHSDGYWDYNGRILEEFYDTEEKVRELIALGDISSLGKSINDTVAYHRDRGEPYDSTKPITSRSYEIYLVQYNQEYNYLFVENKWKVK